MSWVRSYRTKSGSWVKSHYRRSRGLSVLDFILPTEADIKNLQNTRAIDVMRVVFLIVGLIIGILIYTFLSSLGIKVGFWKGFLLIAGMCVIGSLTGDFVYKSLNKEGWEIAQEEDKTEMKYKHPILSSIRDKLDNPNSKESDKQDSVEVAQTFTEETPEKTTAQMKPLNEEVVKNKEAVKNEEREETKAINKKLFDYVKYNLDKGVSGQDLYGALLNAGWDSSQIKDAINLAESIPKRLKKH